MTRYTPPTHKKTTTRVTDDICSACGARVHEIMGVPVQAPVTNHTRALGVRVADNLQVIERACSSCGKPCPGEPSRKTRRFSLDRFPHLRSQYDTQFNF